MFAALSHDAKTSCCCESFGYAAYPCCRQTGAGRKGSRQLDAALAVAESIKRPILRMPNKEEVAAMDRLIMEVASPRTKRILQDYKQQSKVRLRAVCSLQMPSAASHLPTLAACKPRQLACKLHDHISMLACCHGTMHCNCLLISSALCLPGNGV